MKGSNMQYAGFWKRFLSICLDIMILYPITMLIIRAEIHSKTIHLAIMIAMTLLYNIYFIYMNANYGGTPGKLIVGIRIRTVGGERISYKEAFLRSVVDISFSVVLLIFQLYTLWNIKDPSYNYLSRAVQLKYLYNNLPEAHGYFSVANQIWIWCELVVILLNKKRRALHDFIAGTVVVTLGGNDSPQGLSIEEKLDKIIGKLES